LSPHGVASVVAIAVLTYFHIVVGEMIPKSLALQRAEHMALWITPPMLWIKTIMFPLVVGLNEIGNMALKLVGVNRREQSPEQYYTAEELQLIVQESEELGAIRAESGQMLQVLFDFANLTASEVMVPRVKVTGIPLGTAPLKIRELLKQSPHTRYPVFEHDLDHIVGMIHIKDLLRLLLRSETLGTAHVRPLPVIPETAAADSVLASMRRERTQMVVVIDEHGGTAGIVTLEDLFEEVVGDIDAGPGSAAQPYRDADGRLRVPGTMRLDELGQYFDLDLEHEEVDSVSGIILTLLGRPPQIGDTVRYDRIVLEVTAIKGHGVEEAAVSLAA
jgi:CBS domain containing-hemolysin-like protein